MNYLWQTTLLQMILLRCPVVVQSRISRRQKIVDVLQVFAGEPVDSQMISCGSKENQLWATIFFGMPRFADQRRISCRQQKYQLHVEGVSVAGKKKLDVLQFFADELVDSQMISYGSKENQLSVEGVSVAGRRSISCRQHDLDFGGSWEGERRVQGRVGV